MKKIIQEIKNSIENTKTKKPLTHCITNTVTTNDCANAILAIGASPIMADDEDEVEEIVKIADALIVNIGKLSKEQIAAMKRACNYASKTNTPIVLDPVGCGISKLRDNLTKDILNNYKVSAIRGNMSEVKAIAKIFDIEKEDDNKAKGVDVSENDVITKNNLDINGLLVKNIAKKFDCVVIASGPIDIISDGEKLIATENGDGMMEQITGSGCMLSSILGSYIASNDALIGSITASLIMSIAGEEAKKYVDDNNSGTGTFRSKLIDNLYLIDSEKLINKTNMYLIE